MKDLFKYKKHNLILSIFLLLTLLQYIYTSNSSIEYFFNFTKYDFNFLENLILFLYVPFLFYLIYKKNKFGWILLVLRNAYDIFLILKLFFLAYYDGTTYVQIAYPKSLLLYLIFSLIFNFYLCRPRISNLFGISPALKKTILLLIIAFTTIYIIIFNALINNNQLAIKLLKPPYNLAQW